MDAGGQHALKAFIAPGDEQSNRLFGAMVDALPVAIYTTDSEGRLTYFNAAAVSLSGRVPDLGTDQWCITWKLFSADGAPLPHDQCPMSIALAGGDVATGAECIAERPDGTRFWFTPYPVILRDANGQITGGMNLLVDITDRKNAQIEATETVRQLRLITENMDVGVARCTADLRYSWVSRTYAHWLGRMPDEIAGRPIVDVMGKEGYDSIRPYVEEVLSGQRVEFEKQMTLVAAGTQWVHSVYVPTLNKGGKADGWIAVLTNVTGWRESEERLRTNERQLKEAQHLAKVGSWELDVEANTFHWSDEMIHIFGHPKGPPLNFRDVLGYVHLNDREKFLEADRKVRLSTTPVEVEFRIVRPDGEVRFARAVAEAIRNDRGAVVRIAGATQDVTGPVKAREFLRASEQRLKSAQQLTHVGSWHWDLEADRVVCSEECLRIFGQPDDYAPSLEGLLEMITPSERERVAGELRGGLADRSGCATEFHIIRPNGKIRAISFTSQVSLDEEGSLHVFGACQDVTDVRRAQEESISRQKLESVGTLASGIAHDFNNLLGGVLAQAELALAELASGSRPEEELKTIRNVAFRGSEIVRQLMSYAGKDSEAPELVDVSRIIAEMVELLKALVSRHATLDTNLSRDLPAVRGSAAQLQQIVMNLVTNASDAIGDRDGVIRVVTSYVKIGRDSSGAISDRLAAGDYLKLEVSDTGCGMSPETQTRVFDPFFTTKSAGRGLGLAVVDGLVRGLHGTIHVTSAPGRGSAFYVLLPCVETPAGASSAPMIEAGKPALAEEFTVLVVEDEDPLRQAVVKMLRKAGFGVLEAADGSAAIDVLRGNAGKIDLVLLDVTIPGAPSTQVIAEAAKIRRDTRVILTSAYSREMLTPAFNTALVRGFVRKPFQLAELLRTIRENLQ